LSVIDGITWDILCNYSLIFPSIEKSGPVLAQTMAHQSYVASTPIMQILSTAVHVLFVCYQCRYCITRFTYIPS